MDNVWIQGLVQNPNDPAVLYAGTRAGVYWTTDGGLTWSPRSGSVTVSYVEALAIDPQNPAVLYAGAIWAANWGVRKTVDGGATWNAVGSGIPTALHITDILIDPTDSNVIYVSTQDPHNYAADDAGVYKSTDGGGSFEPAGNGLLCTEVRCLEFQPGSPQIIYAGADGDAYHPGGGLHVTYDGGANWSWLSSGLPIETGFWIYDIAVVPEDVEFPRIYIAAAYDYELPMPPQSWDARLYVSSPGWDTWSLASSGIAYPNLYAVAVDPNNIDTVYAGAQSGGVFRSTDAATSWQHDSAGLQQLNVRSIAVAPDDPNTVYVSTDAWHSEYELSNAGVFVSRDGGVTWTPRNQDLWVNGSFAIESVAIAKCDQVVLYAAASGWCMYKSEDGGAHWLWRGFPHGMNAYWVRQVVVNPDYPNVAYVTVAGYEPDWPDIFKTTDCGETWFPVASNLVYAAFEGITIDPTDSETIYAGTHWEGVWKTTNGGGSWTHTGSEVDELIIRAVAVDAQQPEHVYVGDSDYEGTGVWVSYNGGNSWQQDNAGLLNLRVNAIVIDSVPGTGEPYPAVVYAGTGGGGVHCRQDDTVWIPMNDGLENLSVYTLALGPLPIDNDQSIRRALYAGTARGLYRWTLFGDMNCDGEINFDDITPFVLALVSAGDYQAIYPLCFWMHADCNDDGTVNFDDIDGFIELLVDNPDD